MMLFYKNVVSLSQFVIPAQGILSSRTANNYRYDISTIISTEALHYPVWYHLLLKDDPFFLHVL